MAQDNGKKQRPVFSKRYFPVQVAVFEHKNAEDKLNHSVILRRSFRRDPESEWETTEYLSAQDLLPAAKLLSEAYSFVQKRLQQAFQQGRAESQEELVAADVPF
jgi:hypothetical protein